MPQSLPQERPLTKLAKNYTHPIGLQHAALLGIEPLKSGLTPLDPFQLKTIDDYLVFWSLRGYQVGRFDGFTAADFQACDAFAPDYDLIVELDGDISPVHPLFARDNWSRRPDLKHRPLFPVGDGGQGYYEGNNDIVWATILPAIRIASRIMTLPHTLLWFDALVFGKREDIPRPELQDKWPKDELHRRFRLRDPLVAATPEATQLLEQRIFESSKIIRLAFADGRCRDNGMPARPEMMCYGRCCAPDLTIATQLVARLLIPGMTTGERAAST